MEKKISFCILIILILFSVVAAPLFSKGNGDKTEYTIEDAKALI